jgi:hypothetical protein
VRLGVLLLVPISFACSLGELDLNEKRCPCVEGYLCDEARRVCVRSLPDAKPTADSGAPCAVKASDTRLYCTNRVPSNIRSAAKNTATIVDELRTAYSWFSCWTVGERHAGGNTTWYYTLGDRDGDWGYVAAVDVVTPPGFNENPSAFGLVKCP